MERKTFISRRRLLSIGKLHIGNAYTTVAADSSTEANAGLRCDVSHGTDEHGMKIEQSAKAAGMKPKEFVDEIVEGPGGSGFWKLLNISNDRFIDNRRIPPGYSKRYLNDCTIRVIYIKANMRVYTAYCEAFWTMTQARDGNCPDWDAL